MAFKFKRGGIHPADNKFSKDSEIEVFPISDIKLFYFPLSQHIGKPANPVVKLRDEIKRGQLIAESTGFISANIHSSVNGIVKKIDAKQIVIEKTDDNQKFEELKFTAVTELAEIAKMAGIVGLGGATFPSNVKLSPPDPNKVDAIVINGAECEPYLTSDYRLMLENGKAIIEGIKLIQKSLPTNPKAYIGIEKNKPNAIKLLQDLVLKEINIEVAPLRTRYPQGGEKQLIEAILGREVPSGKLPFDVGVIVHNIGTVFALYEAYNERKPLIERVMTVSGSLVNKSKNFLVPLGLSFEEIMKYLEIKKEDIVKLVDGGPMMGKAITDLNTPVKKGTSGLLFLGQKDVKTNEEKDCISCAMCVDVCPVGLLPTRLALNSKKENHEENLLNYNLMDCIECGSCSYACPSDISIVQYIKTSKYNINMKKNKQRG